MIRTVIYVLAGIFVISVVRLILTTMGKMFNEMSTGASTSVPKSGELKKCAACGTYAPAALAPRVKGVDVFLCSEACAKNYHT